MKYPLKHPIQLGKAKVVELEFRDHTTASDYLAFDRKGGVAQNIALIASMTGSDEALIGRLHGADYIACARHCDQLIASDESEAKEATPEKKSQES